MAERFMKLELFELRRGKKPELLFLATMWPGWAFHMPSLLQGRPLVEVRRKYLKTKLKIYVREKSSD